MKRPSKSILAFEVAKTQHYSSTCDENVAWINSFSHYHPPQYTEHVCGTTEGKITFQKPWFRRGTLSVPHAGNMGPLERYLSSPSRVQVDSITVMIFVIGRYGHRRRYDREDRDGFLGFFGR
ncbi:uncharacterized protein EAF02_001236 [Botrytis sinoallii]|uniref:uncharacterized protein n=1 Tax=Botrytis sinoallii TaxID=1463999 RepID=UPI0018FFD73B|nr:uncharacterized protein EAF02_001236 [Botrytis sinoallii]KAF7893698.1 hypothetical protein EAF02_001236 [Botrytis sinoallii]